MVQRIAFEITVSGTNYKRLQSHTHTPCDVLRREGFKVRGEILEADWPVYPPFPMDEEGYCLIDRRAERNRDWNPGEIIDPDSPDWDRALTDDGEGFTVPTRRVYKRGDKPEVFISERVGWVPVSQIGFMNGGRPEGAPFMFPKAPLRCYAPSDPGAAFTAWRDKGWTKRNTVTLPNGAMMHDADTGEVAA